MIRILTLAMSIVGLYSLVHLFLWWHRGSRTSRGIFLGGMGGAILLGILIMILERSGGV